MSLNESILSVEYFAGFMDEEDMSKKEKCGRCGSKDIKILSNGWKECQFCGSYNPYPNGKPWEKGA